MARLRQAPTTYMYDINLIFRKLYKIVSCSAHIQDSEVCDVTTLWPEA